ncbi:4Fe-4S binding protein [Collinsella sp. AGMB00827]|uniref:4Fe-4S binding protein n=1 Tax=Collinsella ureilytica TaxID=2869515 RepID=A0ABS7MJ50_9ACTN|nr:4Fe-4S binding protein [Collinsella urealyticum]MBY4797401.1 4Fe-4S binding protein [Collinsella urealyticum]
MAQHDLIDDLIDISKGLGSLRDPISGLTDTLLGEAPEAPTWNPADYKERPRANTIPCLVCRHETSACTACMDVCPVDAIDIEDGSIEIGNACRKCGLCVAACPTEAFVSPKLQPKKLYEEISRAALAHETAYITCTRALRRIPRENEVVIACVGAVPVEVWFSVLTEFSNVSVYLPLDICNACKTVTGENQLADYIATAEEWAGTGLGLEVDPARLTCKKRREFERKEFMDDIVRTTGLAVSRLNPAAAAVASVSQRLQAHANRISDLERTLSNACGVTTEKRRRILLQRRQLLLSALQLVPERAESVQVKRPVCDFARCTMCGECVSACPVHACDLVAAGRFSVEPTYCVGCGLCTEVCPTQALSLHDFDGADLVVPDPEAEAREAAVARAHQDAQRIKEEVRGKISSALDFVERLAD